MTTRNMPLLELLKTLPFSPLDVQIIEGCLNGLTYGEIASLTNYSYGYVKKRGKQVIKQLSVKYNYPFEKRNLPCFLPIETDQPDADLRVMVKSLSQRVAKLEKLLTSLGIDPNESY